MSVFLALKCVETIVNSLDVKVIDIYIAVDAQIVLSWVLNNKVKTKNIYAKNRINDIAKFRDDIKNKFDLNAKFKYIPTELNPSDLITRGITFKQLTEKFMFWVHGPSFLALGVKAWPDRPLECLSSENKLLTNVVTLNSNLPQNADSDKLEIFSLERFSSLHMVLRVTCHILRAVYKMRKTNN